ncbi:FRG domain-containing protein [Isoptericola sp. NPDC056573]|uniref:FRG domain-containing protein n=1 Tax=Isoptericola sp. NPDC056573 TaxID=3345868 RepID=UPI0036C96BEC
MQQAALEIVNAVSSISISGPDGGIVWRGQADATWRVESKATRQKMNSVAIRDHEISMLETIRTIGADRAQYTGDWELLARMRHHAAATRLIDVTTDPFVALWFLCDDDSSAAGVNVQTRPGLLLAFQRRAFQKINSPHAVDSYAQLHSRKAARLIYSTPTIDPRIAAQRGLFVLHSDPDKTAFSRVSELGDFRAPSTWGTTEMKNLGMANGTVGRGRSRTNFPEALGIVVPAAVKPVLLDRLEMNFGFTRATMYPDFSGVGQMFAS